MQALVVGLAAELRRRLAISHSVDVGDFGDFAQTLCRPA